MSRARDLADSADLNFDSGTLVIDSANNRVGIGEASPTVPLDVQGNIQASTYLTSPLTSPESAGGTPSDLNTGELGPGYLNLNRDDTAAVNQIQFGKNGAVAAAFETGANDLRIKVNGNTERLRIDSSGNLLVRKTSVGTTSEGAEVRNNGLIAAARDLTGSSGSVLYLNRIGTTNGPIQTFYKDGTTVGSIGTYDTDIHIGSGNVGLSFYDVGDTVLPFNPSTPVYRDNAIDLGNPNNRFKDLYLSGGVYLGGTGAANYLDDYEEGTWTPVMKDTSVGGATVGTTGVTAFYTKVGRFVHATLYIERNDASSLTGTLFVTGLPFTTANYPAVNGGAWFDNVSSDWKTFVYSSPSVTEAYFPKVGNIDGNLATNNWDNNRYIYASFSYITT